MTELEKLVDKAATLSLSASSQESSALAARKRREAREAVNEAIARCGKLIAILNKAEK